MYPLLVWVVAGLVSDARASSVSSETSLGSGTVIEALQFDSSPLDPSEGQPILSCNAGFNYSKTTDYSVNPNVQTKNPELTAGVDLKTPTHWDLGGGLNYAWVSQQSPAVTNTGASASTITTGYTDFGGNLFGGYTFNFQTVPTDTPRQKKQSSQENAIEAAPFSPSLGLKLTLGLNNYKVASSRKLQQYVTKSGTKLPNLRQSDVEPEFDASPLEWVSFKISRAEYHYAGDPATFSDSLENARPALRAFYSGMAGAVSGFPDYVWSWGEDFFPFEKWECDLEQTLSRTITDHSVSRAYKAILFYEASAAWKIGAGYERSLSANAPIENLGIFSLALSW